MFPDALDFDFKDFLLDFDILDFDILDFVFDFDMVVIESEVVFDWRRFCDWRSEFNILRKETDIGLLAESYIILGHFYFFIEVHKEYAMKITIAYRRIR